MSANRQKIVVGVDGSEQSERALAWAIDEAKLHGSRLQVVSVWHVPAIVYGGPGISPALGSAIDGSFREVAEESATTAANRAREAGVEVDVDAQHGPTVDRLLDAAKDADLLVLGSRGHGGFAGLLLGSVSAQCAHHATCPLVIVR
jgi:nucleotide-binding universal stress UspA family protein